MISVCVDSKRGYSAYLESVVSSQDGERAQYRDVRHLVDRCQGLVANRWVTGRTEHSELFILSILQR